MVILNRNWSSIKLCCKRYYFATYRNIDIYRLFLNMDLSILLFLVYRYFNVSKISMKIDSVFSDSLSS